MGGILPSTPADPDAPCWGRGDHDHPGHRRHRARPRRRRGGGVPRPGLRRRSGPALADGVRPSQGARPSRRGGRTVGRRRRPLSPAARHRRRRAPRPRGAGAAHGRHARGLRHRRRRGGPRARPPPTRVRAARRSPAGAVAALALHRRVQGAAPLDGHRRGQAVAFRRRLGRGPDDGSAAVAVGAGRAHRPRRGRRGGDDGPRLRRRRHGGRPGRPRTTRWRGRSVEQLRRARRSHGDRRIDHGRRPPPRHRPPQRVLAEPPHLANG